MRHLRTVRRPGVEYVTDPTTGRSYPRPAGGSDGDGGGGSSSESDGGEADTGETPDGSEEESSSDSDTDSDESGGAGSKSAVLADLKRERTRRQELEAEIAQLRQEHESDDERREREAREREDAIRTEAQAPAITALRRAALETAARSAGFHDPADAALILTAEGRVDEIEVDLATATPDREAAKSLVADLAERRPHLIAAEGTPGVARGGSDTQQSNGGTSTDPDTPDLRTLVARRLSARG